MIIGFGFSYAKLSQDKNNNLNSSLEITTNQMIVQENKKELNEVNISIGAVGDCTIG